jgi:hypothetical protein
MDGTKPLEDKTMACVWCGIEIRMEVVHTRRSRNDVNPDSCRDCRDYRQRPGIMRKQYKWIHPSLGFIYCSLWLDELDDQWRPIDEQGQLVRPGKRICGLKDCVKPEHVIAPTPATVSDIDMILMMHEMQQHNKRTKIRG